MCAGGPGERDDRVWAFHTLEAIAQEEKVDFARIGGVTLHYAFQDAGRDAPVLVFDDFLIGYPEGA